MLGGNFNMITNLDKKRGGRERLEVDNTHFKDIIQQNWLIDLPFANGNHTWNNKRVGTQQISSKLDKFLLSNNAILIGGDF